MHGRRPFQFTREEQERLREYLDRGGIYFADACCSAAPFDRSFRELMEQIFPSQKLKRIPPKHELFTTLVGHDLERVKRRETASEASGSAGARVVDAEPFLEGIEVKPARFIVIYSKYDISCALERQIRRRSVPHTHEKMPQKIATNVVLYTLLQ